MCYSLSQIRAPNFRARHYYPFFHSSSFIFNFSSIYQYIFPSIFSSCYNTFTFLLLSRLTLSVSSQIFTVWFLSYSIFCFNLLQANFISVIFQHKFSVSRSSNAQRYSVVLSTPSFLCTLFSPNPPLCLICSISFSFLLCSFCQFFIVFFSLFSSTMPLFLFLLLPYLFLVFLSYFLFLTSIHCSLSFVVPQLQLSFQPCILHHLHHLPNSGTVSFFSLVKLHIFHIKKSLTHDLKKHNGREHS